MAKVLVFQANPQGTTMLRLNNELRAIRQAVEANSFHSLELEFLGAVRKDDLQSSLIKYSPEIVHFCGHGTEKGELILEDSSGDMSVLDVRALSAIFSNFSDSIKCVVLNSCYSKEQATGIVRHIPCVVGMSSLVYDEPAMAFSSKFYVCLANGFNVKRAYEIAKTEMMVHDAGAKKNPVLLTRQKMSASEIYISLFPSIQARFKLTRSGNPVEDEGHYSLDIFVLDVPRDVKCVVYQLNDETVEEEFFEEDRRLMNYQIEYPLYGDIEIRATLWRNDGSGLGLSNTLGHALRQYYMNRRPAARILNAIKEIEGN